MTILVDIEQDKKEFFIELINNLPFVKYYLISENKKRFILEMNQAVKNLNSIKKNKMKAIPLDDVLNEI
ncbi:MAG: hypothetical protein A2X61_04175 [Ignavibacteria bacterium GWB2_35_12]|nr:MAG: hypothetical protein A2X63_08840 [Ignavibacteria bacterium GWA2_35_8]OGU38877.1 MAG: hypothetical protein A2X61_04175 [Ignavibacteria bacterium GWB2_35_12]OGU94394.1 MAG: hypothetical protein A2220_14360 [Ignavibacteria bacterium RIFOXYA2_FULL_35_10]OGV20331.1 MAG: hypothetical protein A2475_11950 [Ignavibacteria bacterium RIFOXYC2_FULL_35_21]